MSRRSEVQKALRRASSRDKKRQPRMKVSGKSVFTLSKLGNTKK